MVRDENGGHSKPDHLFHVLPKCHNLKLVGVIKIMLNADLSWCTAVDQTGVSEVSHVAGGGREIAGVPDELHHREVARIQHRDHRLRLPHPQFI